MSTITEALKKAKNIHLLVELEFEGLTKRYALSDVSVPHSAGDSKFFEGAILRRFNVGTNFSLTSQKYSVSSVGITLANKNRLQDEETRRRLDAGTGKVYVWCEGLDWADIDPNGLIFSGVVNAGDYDYKEFSIALEEQTKARLKRLPGTTINASTWPNHRTEGGASSVAGTPQPLLFGDWSKGVPLRCVDTAAFKYIVHVGVAKSTDADYTGAVENVYDKDGSVIGAVNYTFYPGGVDGLGNIVAYFDFIADQAANEPLSCSIRAAHDGSGEYTGTAGTLIEHPAHILHYLLGQHSWLISDEINVETIKTMRSSLPGLKFATMINAEVEGIDLIDRLLRQCQCARLPRAGGIGVMTFDTDAIEISRIIEDADLMTRPKFSRTPETLICNNLRVSYAPNPTTKKYEGELIRDRYNDTLCKLSYHQYGEYPQREFKLPDVQDEATAIACTDRYLSMHAFRHDIVNTDVPYWVGFETLEGDGALLTLADGPSVDGAGWVEEKCILLDRQFKKDTIKQRWWRVGTG